MFGIASLYVYLDLCKGAKGSCCVTEMCVRAKYLRSCRVCGETRKILQHLSYKERSHGSVEGWDSDEKGLDCSTLFANGWAFSFLSFNPK